MHSASKIKACVTTAENIRPIILECESSKCGNVTLLSHSGTEICAIISGSGVHKTPNLDIPCRAGDVFITPPATPHAFLSNDDGERMVIRKLCFLTEEWLEGEVASIDSLRYCYGALDEGATVTCTVLTQSAQDALMHIMDTIEQEVREQSNEWHNAVRASLELMLITLGRQVNSAIRSISGLSRSECSVVYDALREVEKDFGDADLTLDVISDRLYVSRSTLSRLFKRVTGKSFSDHLRFVRLERATDLLKSTSLNVREIMLSCGMRDMPSFYHNFSLHTGMTPQQYRTVNQTDKEKRKKGEIIMSILKEISENLQKGKAKLVRELCEQALAEGCDPNDILNEGLLDGMSVIGEKFKRNEVYVPEVLVAARAMNMGTQVLKPHLIESGVQAKGRVCIGTVQGDLHDIGKNLVRMMMEGKGLEVIDLGVDVSPETFVNTAIEQHCDIICCSALLTTTMDAMGDVVRIAEEKGVRDSVKIMVGGAPVSEDFCRRIGADVYTSDAASAADAAIAICANK